MSLKKLRRRVYHETIVKKLSQEFGYSLENCLLVSSHGLARLAHGHYRFHPCFDPKLFWFGSHYVFYLRTDDVEKFLPKISVRPSTHMNNILLLVGDSDTPVGGSTRILLEEFAIRNAPMWVYCQNLAEPSKVLNNVPIGLDYHSNFFSNDFFQPDRKLPLHQELALIDLLSMSEVWHSRSLQVSVDWAGSTHRGDRLQALNSIPKNLSKLTDFGGNKRVNQGEIWKQHLSCQFVASPFGVGLDCHRTWEAIALGCVPITCRSGLSPLFKNLPVLELDDWSELTEERLLQAADEFSKKTFDFGVMFMSYWREVFANGVPESSRYQGKLEDWPSIFRAEFDRNHWDCA